jgi:hypothetical protein
VKTKMTTDWTKIDRALGLYPQYPWDKPHFAAINVNAGHKVATFAHVYNFLFNQQWTGILRIVLHLPSFKSWVHVKRIEN